MNEIDAKARAAAHAVIEAHIGPDARGVDKRALFYTLVEALTKAQQGHIGSKTAPLHSH